MLHGMQKGVGLEVLLVDVMMIEDEVVVVIAFVYDLQM